MEIIFILLLLLVLHYIYFLRDIYNGLQKLNVKTGNKQSESISVIIPFRNESINILKSLNSMCSQIYPEEKFEVIYVDDSSEDDSLKKICEAEKKENIKVLSVPASNHDKAHKKRAIAYAISNCKGEIILMTDCDCLHKEVWVSTMVNAFDSDTDFVAGPVAFSEQKDLFGKIQQLEFSGLILAGAGLIGIEKPVICNSANVAFRKKDYERVNGFNDNMNLSSGDDELLMQKIAIGNEARIKFCFNKNAVVRTDPNRGISDFFEQRKRWASKTLFYKNRLLKIKLVLIYIFYLSLLVTFIAGLFIKLSFLMIFLILMIFKIIPEYMILKKGSGILFGKISSGVFLLTEFLQTVYITIAGVAGLFGNYSWKNRKIKR